MTGKNWKSNGKIICMIAIRLDSRYINGCHMTTRKPLYQLGEALVKQLQAEAMMETLDDDRPSVPDPFDSLASAQSRRQPVEVA